MFGYVLTNDVRFAARYALLDLRLAHAQAVFVVLGRAVLVHLFETVFGAKAIVCVAAVQKFLRIFEIDLFALRLHVRTVIAARYRTFVIRHARFVQCGNNDIDRAFDLAGLICVFYAKDKLAAVLFGEQIGVERGAQAADV